ncbi:MAG: c-type cytochrome [Candidatus Thiodiazotropha sp. (ex. Lucinoma kazani)]|nr:c-type cytochrome [Candidatus Thiodiazotropha sp. (ex Lucinoma borealis)]
MKNMKKQLSALSAGLLLGWVVTGCATQTPSAQAPKTTKPAAAPAVAAKPAGVRSPSMLANTCAGCHGTNGASAGKIMPIIGGMEKEYMQLVLEEFKTGERDSTIMGRIAKGYSENELKAIASYLADQTWVSSPFKADPKLAAIGKKIHEKQCKTCHEDGGRVQEDDAPRLAGQWPDYSLHYLKDCHKKGRRCAPRKMGSRVMKLSQEELNAMAHYYASEK